MSLLRELVDEEAFKKDAASALLDAALLVRRAGLEHLVIAPSLSEVMVLAAAGEIVADERALVLMQKLRDPAKALEPYDGGAALRREVLDQARALAAREGR